MSCAGGDELGRRRLRDIALTDYQCDRRGGVGGTRELTWRGIEQLARAALEGSPRLQLHVSGMTLHASGRSITLEPVAAVEEEEGPEESEGGAEEQAEEEAEGSERGQSSGDEAEQPSFLGYAETEWGGAVLAALPPGARRRLRIVEKQLRSEDLFDNDDGVLAGGGV